MAIINILNSHVFVFIAVLLLAIIVFAFYEMIRPENSVPYNFNPIPQLAPTDLPDPAHKTDSCWSKLTPCDSEGQCSACSTGQYKCVQVSEEEADQGYYHFNGITIDRPGSYCLPQDNNPNPVCNLYTGRWLWVYDPAYCSTHAPDSDHPDQCWKCECLYPTLYSDSNTGCTTQQACQNRSPLSHSTFQPENVLIGSKYAPKELQGVQWDPISGVDKNILTYSPYTTDKDGNPWFVCNCKANTSNQFFTTLPNDPHTCHLEPCYSYYGSTAKGLNPSCDYDSNGNDCYCSCSTNTAVAPEVSAYKGTCVSVQGSCGNGGYDDKSGKCVCGAPYWQVQCRSTFANTGNGDLPECQNVNTNALGSQCVDPCQPNPCQHETKCITHAPSSDVPGSLPFATCDCSSYPDSQAPPPKFEWGGQYCADQCLPAGTTISTGGINYHNPCASEACCCSGQSHATTHGIGEWRRQCIDGDRKDSKYGNDFSQCVLRNLQGCGIE